VFSHDLIRSSGYYLAVEDFEEVFWRLSRQLLNMVGAQVSFSQGHEPYVELTETKEGVALTAEVPGVRAQDIRVKARPDHIRLQIVEAGETVYSSIFETRPIDPEAVRISLKNGILEVNAPNRKGLF
jgi:HSP20 family molecular chaperone IbpA